MFKTVLVSAYMYVVLITSSRSNVCAHYRTNNSECHCRNKPIISFKYLKIIFAFNFK